MYLSKPGNPIITMPGLAVAIDAFDSNVVMDSSNLVARVQNLGNQGAADAVQVTDIRKPKFVAGAINGCPAFEGLHDGTNNSQLSIADSAGLNYTEFTSFTVLQRVTDTNAVENVVGKYTATGNLREHRVQIVSDLITPAISTDGTSGTLSSLSATGALSTGVGYIAEAVYQGTSLTARRNGQGTTSGTVASVFNGTSTYDLYSRDTSFADPYAGYIGAHYFFTRALSAPELQQIRNILSRRWRITLS